MVDFRLTEEQMMIRDMAREFSEEEVLPHAEEWDREGEEGETHRRANILNLLVETLCQAEVNHSQLPTQRQAARVCVRA